MCSVFWNGPLSKPAERSSPRLEVLRLGDNGRGWFLVPKAQRGTVPKPRDGLSLGLALVLATCPVFSE